MFNFIDMDAHELAFEPTLAVPALQFFEGVETTGMAMRAGLRPGDFLLEINGIDVRRASHEQVLFILIYIKNINAYFFFFNKMHLLK